MWCLIFKEVETMYYVEDTEQCCGNCKYWEYDKEENEWYCNNLDSKTYGILTAYADGCEEWEDREHE